MRVLPRRPQNPKFRRHSLGRRFRTDHRRNIGIERIVQTIVSNSRGKREPVHGIDVFVGIETDAVKIGLWILAKYIVGYDAEAIRALARQGALGFSRSGLIAPADNQ